MIDMEVEQEFATRCYGKEMYNDGKAEGETFAFIKMFKQGLISEEVVMNNLNITKEELKKLI